MRILSSMSGKVLVVTSVLVGLSARAQVVQQPIGEVIITPVPQAIELGPVLDVIPYVLSDGYTVNLTLIPTVTEFVGYDDPNAELPPSGAGLQNAVLTPTVLPRFRVRQVTSTVNVWDGQTVVLGGLVSDTTQKFKDKVPVLGDVPWLGKLFRSEGSRSEKKNLLIFVTPTLIDPAGNRLHSEEDLPFAASSIPPQEPGSDIRPIPQTPAEN